ncbi:hypothetical protein [Cryptosporangium minutisporangium]|uniref:hypothetical protein n=1 Tax=Cryptosporangium minutisporangium TaxID=113569 RepID=UPI0035EE1C05
MSTEPPSGIDARGPADGPHPARWAVWRQDDNGNRYEIVRKDSRAEAEALAAEFEARGHKQMYWVAEVPAPPP